MSKLHFLRYGTAAEQKYMLDYQHTYDCIAINGSMLAHITKGISIFMHKDIVKNFLIDPMTHSFQHRLDKIQNSDGEIKSSIKKLINIYGPPVSTVLNTLRPIKSNDFNKKNIPPFVKNVLSFQLLVLKENLDSEYKDYIEYMNLYREPMFLIAPYFYMREDTFDQWYQLNLDFIREAIKQKGQFKNKNIYALLVIDKKILLAEDKLDKITSDYSLADGLIYWVDGLDETEADTDVLRAIKSLIKKYKKRNPKKRLITLYGGYFSELLLSIGLDGVVHGLEYGESRDVVPVGGGIPLSKYYLPEIKKRLPATTMLRLLKVLKINSPRKFHAEICKCRVCKSNIKKDINDFNNFIKSKPDPVIIKYKKSGNIREVYYPERESKELCLFHYLEVKNNEFNSIKNERNGLQQRVQRLRDAYKKYKEYLPDEELDHLIRWADIIGV